ncbi:gap junction delta-2 protein-like [Petromyzon marinus]|uniref:gap junction delta-2 protein-like n=1 Tax=Petromyzon marinus TaxID=7757 RepID=UPI003F6F1D3D
MGEWTILERLLAAAVHQHATMIGRILLTVVVIFRILIVAIVGETVYGDEQTMFVCNTLQPGCNQVCYDKTFPISHLRYWVFQIIMVCTPSLCFITYSVHQSTKQWDRFSILNLPLGDAHERRVSSTLHPPLSEARERGGFPVLHQTLDRQEPRGGQPFSVLHPPTLGEAERRYRPKKRDCSRTFRTRMRAVFGCRSESRGHGGGDDGGGGGLSRETKPSSVATRERYGRFHTQESISRFYILQVVLRNVLEIVFLIGQYFLYGLYVPSMVACERHPCIRQVECYVSRPTEKTVFLLFMFGVSGLCLVLNLAELNHLGWRKIKGAMQGVRTRKTSFWEIRHKDFEHAIRTPRFSRTHSSESAYV